jgi:tetratricopeptide (TPR) repeat protein
MGRLILIIVLLATPARLLWSQDVLTPALIEKETLALYHEGSWKELTAVGVKAIKNGVDYFYLRMRLGIAYYERNDYSRAITHFKKALEFNSADNAALEYLYFSYMLLGRDMEAGVVAAGFPRSLTEKLALKGNGVRAFSLNTTGSFTADPEIIDDYHFGGGEAPAGSQSLTRKFLSFGASLEHESGKHLRLTHSAGYLSRSYLLYSQANDGPELDNDSGLSQFQYYLSGRILLGNGMFLVPSVHYLNIRIPYVATVSGRFGRLYHVRRSAFNHDFASSLQLEKFSGKIRPGLAAGYSVINRVPQVQGSFSVDWFPGGNLNFYTLSHLTWYSVLPFSDDGGQWVFAQDIGFRMFPGLWMELGGSMGERENFAGRAAYLIYNDLLTTKTQYGLAVIAPFPGRGMEISLHYGYTIQESRFIPEAPAHDLPINPITLNNHKISGGIKWKF